MRLIDADIELKRLEEMIVEGKTFTTAVEFAKLIIMNAPTVEAEPVRHGHWALEWETEDTRMLRCSECRMVFNVGNGRDGNYCSNCGAKMDGDTAKVIEETDNGINVTRYKSPEDM